MKKSMHTNLYKCIVAIVVMIIVLLLNAHKQNVIEINLTIANGSYHDMNIYMPHISLPKGTYQFTATGGGGAKVLFCNAQGDVLGIGEVQECITIVLDKDESDVLVCSDAGNLSTIHIEKSGWIFKDTMMISVLLAILLVFVIYKSAKKQQMKERDCVVFLMIGLVIFISYPIFQGSILYGHDINFHLYRIEGIKDGLLAGQFPVRIHPTHNNEYGYITASVYPELFLYIPAIFRLLGASNVLAYHIFLVFINAMTAICMYISAKGISRSRYVGCIAAIIYTYSTWRVMNLYYRAAIGETLAMVFFPLLFYGLYCLIKGNEKKWWIFTFACTGIFMSHMISTFVAAFVVVVFLAVFFKCMLQKSRFFALLKASITTVLLNAWFLVALFVYYMRLDLFIKQQPENTNFWKHAVFPTQLFQLLGTEFGTSNFVDSGIAGEMSFTLGVGVCICLVLSIFYYFVFSKKNKDVFVSTMFCLSLCFLFMATTLFPWEFLQQYHIVNVFCGFMQFPWRFLSIASAMVVLVAAINLEDLITNILTRKLVMAMAVIVSLIAFLFWANAYQTEVTPIVKKGYAISTSGSTGWEYEYFRTGTNLSLFNRNQYNVSDGVELVSYDKSGTNVTVYVDGGKEGDWIEVPLLNYPGYKAKDDLGNKLEVIDGNNNVVRVSLKDNVTQVDVFYGSFWYIRVAEVISVITLGYVLFECYKYKKR